MTTLFLGVALLCGLSSVLQFWAATRPVRQPGRLPWWMFCQMGLMQLFMALGFGVMGLFPHHRFLLLAIALLSVGCGISVGAVPALLSLCRTEQDRGRREAARINRAA